MYRLRRAHPPDKVVLDNISLSFFPGAKIGVLGANGAGKSTLLRIMAGLDREFSGDAVLAPGATVGLLPQEPDLDPSKDVRGNIEEGVAGLDGAAAPLRGDRRPPGRGRAGRDGGAARRVPGGPGRDRAAQRLGHRAHARRRHGRAAGAARRPGRHHALRRRAPPRGALQAAAVGARPAAARRAHEPPRRRVGGVARAPPRGVPGHRRRRDPRPLLPRQRGRLDPRARPRQGHPLEGQLLVLARAEAHAPGAGGEGRVGAPEGPRPRAGVGAQLAAGAAGQEQGAPRELRAPGGRGGRAPRRRGRDPHPAGPAPGRPGRRGRRAHQGVRRPPADGGPLLLGAAGRRSSASSAPTAPARRPCSA